jgi:hypothetical protein
MIDMTQFLGAKEPQTFVANSFIPYDYASDTQVDILTADRVQYLLLHYLLKSKL